MKQLIVIAHDIRSAHNVGSLLRTAEGLGVSEVLLTGYTPYPELSEGDSRLPHERQKINKAIHKTSLGAETMQPWRHYETITSAIADLRSRNFVVAGLEQTPDSQRMPDYTFPDKLAVILGSEVTGMAADVLTECDVTLEIPMAGQKESFNVVQAAAMLAYQWRFL